MNCAQLISELKSWAKVSIDESRTCDTVKIGDPEKELKKVAVTMFATHEVIKKAADWGADMIIVHEPLFYNHLDKLDDSRLVKTKYDVLDKTGMVVFRFHDHAHAMLPDLICEGTLNALGIEGEFNSGKYFAVNSFTAERSYTAKELAEIAERTLGIKHVRIAGAPDACGSKISCCFGTPGHLEAELEESDMIMTGEICEWGLGEMVRDYALLGRKKAILVMGHIGSERAGMKYLAEILKENHSEFETEYFECEEVYSYTDTEEKS